MEGNPPIFVRYLFLVGVEGIQGQTGRNGCTCVHPVPILVVSSVQFSCSIVSDSLRHKDMNCRMPGLPVHHQLLEFTQTHVHRVGDVIQPSHPLSSPFPPAPNPSQHQSLFQHQYYLIPKRFFTVVKNMQHKIYHLNHFWMYNTTVTMYMLYN